MPFRIVKFMQNVRKKRKEKSMTDIEIAQSVKMQSITKISRKIGLKKNDILKIGKFKAKIPLEKMKELENKKDGKLILVTAINPTSAGEGKTTISVGLAQGLNKIKKKNIVCLREPSLGPVFGIKGGAAGGGYSQVIPMDELNLHFTGDFHAITSANNLISAAIDNNIYFGNSLDFDLEQITFPRCLDMNDRALRKINLQLKKTIGRKESFVITPASEIMAILCLASDLDDLKKRLSKIIIGFNTKGNPITVKDLNIEGALSVLLKDAINPNIVQTLEHSPVFIHGGPFANIAHGCSSLISTKMALKLAPFVVTEAGFGSDLGMEKFFGIKCRQGNLTPNAVVLVVTTQALKLHGLAENYMMCNLNALEKGFENMEKHIENIKMFGVPLVVAINVFDTDSKEELNAIKNKCSQLGVTAVEAYGHARGGDGMKLLANEVVNACKQENNFKQIYEPEQSIEEKLEIITKKVYGGKGIELSEQAKNDVKLLKKIKLDNLPICVAKTQYSLSDNPKLLGKPTDFKLKVESIIPSAGAGFLVVKCGKIMRMPGLPKKPAAEGMDVDKDGVITGLF